MWFFAGTFDGHVNRQCTIPAGRSIFLPVINIEASINDTEFLTEQALVSFTRSHMDSIDISALQMKIDDVLIDKLDRYRIQHAGL